MTTATLERPTLHLVDGSTRPAQVRTPRRSSVGAAPAQRRRAGDALLRIVLLHVVGPRLPEDLRTDLRRVVKARQSV